MTSYYSKKTIEVPIASVESITTVYMLFARRRKLFPMPEVLSPKKIAYYKITFSYEEETNFAFFYKSEDLYSYDEEDLQNYIGVS